MEQYGFLGFFVWEELAHIIFGAKGDLSRLDGLR